MKLERTIIKRESVLDFIARVIDLMPEFDWKEFDCKEYSDCDECPLSFDLIDDDTMCEALRNYLENLRQLKAWRSNFHGD